MSVKLGLLVTLEAKDGKSEELGRFLLGGRELAVAELGTITWYAFRVDENRYGIFDTFETDEARTEHLGGPIRRALGEVAGELLASDPVIQSVDVIAVK